jgi:hypothetical protein
VADAFRLELQSGRSSHHRHQTAHQSQPSYTKTLRMNNACLEYYRSIPCMVSSPFAHLTRLAFQGLSGQHLPAVRKHSSAGTWRPWATVTAGNIVLPCQHCVILRTASEEGEPSQVTMYSLAEVRLVAVELSSLTPPPFAGRKWNPDKGSFQTSRKR